MRWLWEGRRWREPLSTTDGRPLSVIDPGDPAPSGGPDYRHAALRLGEQPVTGDVELHVRASDWRHHRHATDPAYNDVVLQVVLWDDAPAATRSDGATIPLLSLAPFLDGPWHRLAPLAAGDSHACLACRRAAATQGEAAALSLLAELGLARQEAKAVLLAERIADLGPSQALYGALLAAVALPSAGEGAWTILEALPLATLPPQTDDAATALQAAWAAVGGPRRYHRPAGAVSPRLQALAALLVTWRGDIARAACELLVAAHGEPRHLERTLTEGGLPPAQAAEWAANALVPWALAWARQSGRPTLAEAARLLFLALPKRQEYGVTRRHAEALFGPGGARKVRRLSQQQGLLHLEKTLCPRGACPWQTG